MVSKSLNVALRQLARAAACRWIAWLPFLYTIAKFLLELSLPMWVLGIMQLELGNGGIWDQPGNLSARRTLCLLQQPSFVCGDLNSLHSFLTKASR